MKGFTQSEEIGAVELEALVSEHIEHYQAQVKTKLEAVRYAIPQVDFAPLLFGKDRMEQVRTPLFRRGGEPDISCSTSFPSCICSCCAMPR